MSIMSAYYKLVDEFNNSVKTEKLQEIQKANRNLSSFISDRFLFRIGNQVIARFLPEENGELGRVVVLQTMYSFELPEFRKWLEEVENYDK